MTDDTELKNQLEKEVVFHFLQKDKTSPEQRQVVFQRLQQMRDSLAPQRQTVDLPSDEAIDKKHAALDADQRNSYIFHDLTNYLKIIGELFATVPNGILERETEPFKQLLDLQHTLRLGDYLELIGEEEDKIKAAAVPDTDQRLEIYERILRGLSYINIDEIAEKYRNAEEKTQQPFLVEDENMPDVIRKLFMKMRVDRDADLAFENNAVATKFSNSQIETFKNCQRHIQDLLRVFPLLANSCRFLADPTEEHYQALFSHQAELSDLVQVVGVDINAQGNIEHIKNGHAAIIIFNLLNNAKRYAAAYESAGNKHEQITVSDSNSEVSITNPSLTPLPPESIWAALGGKGNEGGNTGYGLSFCQEYAALLNTHVTGRSTQISERHHEVTFTFSSSALQ